MDSIRIDDLQVMDDAPRIQDLRLAEALGFARPRAIRQLIVRKVQQLKRHGEVCATVAQTSEKGGRAGTEYWLNEGQALTVCVHSETERADDVIYEIIVVFMAYRSSPHGVANSNAMTFQHVEPEVTPSSEGSFHGVTNLHNAPLALLRFQLDLAAEVRMAAGPEAGRRKLAEFGFLADTATRPPVHDGDAFACLAHLLGFRIEVHVFDADAGEMVEQALTLRQMILRAAQGEQHIGVDLESYGLVIERFGDRETHVWVANQCDLLQEKVFAGTRWAADGASRDALKRLPGVFRTDKGYHRVGSRRAPSGGWYLPLSLVDDV